LGKGGALLTAQGGWVGGAGVACVDRATMQRYNNEFRHREGATDVLSFPALTMTHPGE
jgi:ssRNA-specific RNase YbeY (16S rRNA maturation enzyme)